MDEIKIDSEKALLAHIVELCAQWQESKYLLVKVRTGQQRTLTQNNSLHMWCKMLSDLLNDSGLDMRKVMRQDVDIPWTQASVKDRIWKPVQEAVIGKESTTEADRNEYTKVFEVISVHLAKKFGVTVPEWPRKEE